ncbi:MAG: asparagine synthase (glutamine-hydrolyzing) [Oceanicoccus sp.]|uniref:asparagine synthase (glutamine-hydrolyzing) n=1 Tax=Oceanicoccus sp. TaxID=2691044 RepID=UPI00262F1913|nr:asparagine synthase (glutamine-hydrolyzing) [Oceanicoccus sp.]MDG1772706.1 asparagine synthase (glutamine-hydrolyzing) [Oceanicoccus sp.]
MCGIAGGVFLSAGQRTKPSEIVSNMTDALLHRGPNSSGIWCDDDRVVLGHRRLSIVDLSNLGRQPMLSPSGRWVLVLNGEIYNHKAIAKELVKLGDVFRGHSDTEVLAAAIERWGVAGAVKRCVGMFAIAAWDKESRQLYLVRDRMGEKPLYYGFCGKDLIFASELKALKAHPKWEGEIDRGALSEFLRYGYVPTPKSIYKDINKLEASTILTVSFAPEKGGEVKYKKIKYWDLKVIAQAGRMAHTEAELTDGFEKQLRSTLRDQMIADVPLGAFLSGGVDSSLVAALMQSESRQPINTFTIGFNDAQFNEAEHAKDIARHIGSKHRELYIDNSQVLDVVHSLPQLYDEPFADPSQLPTYLLCEMAKEHVTVSLSGDGGDELYCGYNRYIYAEKVWSMVRLMPHKIRGLMAAGIRNINPIHFDKVIVALSKIIPTLLSVKTGNSMVKLQKLSAVIQVKDFDELYKLLLSFWFTPSEVLNGAVGFEDAYSGSCDWGSKIEYMMYRDQVQYLQDDNMVKMDRASMAVSLETRSPLLDHRMVEFSWGVPVEYKLREGKSKWLMREVLYKYVPKEMIDRPKMGFSVPIANWLRGPLRGWSERLLDEEVIVKQGYFDSNTVKKYWKEHLTGSHDRSMNLWPLLVFQSWLENE